MGMKYIIEIALTIGEVNILKKKKKPVFVDDRPVWLLFAFWLPRCSILLCKFLIYSTYLRLSTMMTRRRIILKYFQVKRLYLQILLHTILYGR